MTYYADNPYLHAKIHALRSKLLKRNDYIEIINAKKANLAFPGLVTETDAKDLTRVREIVFRSQIDKVIHFVRASEYYTDLFRSFLRFFEVSNFKLLLAKSFGRKVLIEQWNDISPYNEFDRDLLKDNISVSEYKTLLENTYLGNVFSNGFYEKYETIESRIDFYSTLNFFEFSKKISLEQRQIFDDIMLRRVVLLAIVWARRLKESYSWDEDKISIFILSLYRVIEDFPWKDRKIAEIIRQLQKEIDERLGKKESTGIVPETTDIEFELEKYFRSYVWRTFSRDFHSIHCVISYLWLLYYQIQNLFKIIEGFRFNVSPDMLYNKINCEG
ncbi:MAG TPA: V-type ATPase subunit [Desulfobacteraceae bacterium]|nr:V-type ATPase subunit [Desulfobacteraceae bacterium]HPJ68727.1 V-type ATPase subunit [Desulfobacteraceae bacterium]HPQ28090.1 V-type ATPase subunit [Desulfobacteraceae bacterium]